MEMNVKQPKKWTEAQECLSGPTLALTSKFHENEAITERNRDHIKCSGNMIKPAWPYVVAITMPLNSKVPL